MKKIFLLTMLIFPLIACAKNIKIKDGLYYGYWVYRDKEVLKEYGFLANNPRKDAGEYILNPLPELSAANEIYIKVKKNTPSLYYYHESSDADFNVAGWSGAKFVGNDMIVSTNTIRLLKEDSKERISVGREFNGKVVKLKVEEVVPINSIDDQGFNIDCYQYLEANNYAETGIPDVVAPDPLGRKDILVGYPATVFAVGEFGICSALLDDDVVPQIKNGWIQFRRLE